MEKQLTLGMAVYGEFDLFWMTVQALRAYHGDSFDIIVVDNAPAFDQRFMQATHSVGGRYYHRPDLNGTSRPRDAVFHFAKTPWVMCIDSHVLLEPEVVKEALLYAKTHPDSKDIISGPIVWDNGQIGATHWDQPFPPGLWGGWALDARANGKEPFEIHSMGLGLFMMRKEAWPGFNPYFRGFGGEEGYIHEKVRQLGGKAVCLPALRWRHKFRDLGGWDKNPVPYTATTQDHIRNLVLGHIELGIDPSIIKEHFGKKVAPEVWDTILRDAQKIQPFGKLTERKKLKVHGLWYSNNAAPLSLLQQSLQSIQVAAEQSHHRVSVVTCPWESIPGNPFPETLARYKDGPGHLNIVRQQRQCMPPPNVVENGLWVPDIICFLEHDVLYPPDYFDRVAEAFIMHPETPVVSNLDYIGLNATGWLEVRERHEPLHQLSARYEVAVKNLERIEADCAKFGECELEPDPTNGRDEKGWVFLNPDRSRWVRLKPTGLCPSVHVNH